MTTPVPTDPATPSKSKSWVALVGSVLAFAIPLLVQFQGFLPQPWPALIGGLIALLTMFGVYKAPYKPKDTVLVHEDAVPPLPPGGYQKPAGWA
jgi:hypothetical protein